jgi:hypothetical protein
MGIHPNVGSCLQVVVVWFDMIEHPAIRRGTFGSVRECGADDSRCSRRRVSSPLRSRTSLTREPINA